MKISDEISLSARNLLRRKGRTALTLVGVVIGTCMVVLMISLGIAQTKTNEEMLQSWGDLTQVQIYGYGTMVGSDGKPLYLDDAAIANIKQIPHVAAATPYAQAYNLEGTITAGRNDRYTMEIYNLIGIDPTALEPMGFALQSGSWLTNTPASEKAAKLQILVGGSRNKREDDLSALARRMADRVIRTGCYYEMEPMNPYERHIIHTAIAEIDGVRSESKGDGPARHVVLYSTDPDACNLPDRDNARNQRGGRRDGGRGPRRDNRGGRGPRGPREGGRGPRYGGAPRRDNRGGPRSSVPAREFADAPRDPAAKPMAPKTTERIHDGDDFAFGKIEF